MSLSNGRKTPGVDGCKFHNDPETKMKIVEALRDLHLFKSKPVRRVYIPKQNGKLRPLGIPTTWDRCVQHLLKLILEPTIEPFSDLNSFAYRQHRGAHEALGLLRQSLESRENMYDKLILKADIKGFFDEIEHN